MDHGSSEEEAEKGDLDHAEDQATTIDLCLSASYTIIWENYLHHSEMHFNRTKSLLQLLHFAHGASVYSVTK